MRRTPWPRGRPLPRFTNEEDEVAFWERHDVRWDDRAEAEEVPGPAVTIAATRPLAISVVLAPNQETRLGRPARQQRVTKERALAAIIGEALGLPARTARRKRTPGT
jgi:hypothetical protein